MTFVALAVTFFGSLLFISVDSIHSNQTFIEKQIAFQTERISQIKCDVVLLNQCFKNTELLYFLCFRICNSLHPLPTLKRRDVSLWNQ